MMECYMLALYVSLEQELAIRELFEFKGWHFSKFEDQNVRLLQKLVADHVLPVKEDYWDNVEALQGALTGLESQAAEKSGGVISFLTNNDELNNTKDDRNENYIYETANVESGSVEGNIEELSADCSSGLDVHNVSPTERIDIEYGLVDTSKMEGSCGNDTGLNATSVADVSADEIADFVGNMNEEKERHRKRRNSANNNNEGKDFQQEGIKPLEGLTAPVRKIRKEIEEEKRIDKTSHETITTNIKRKQSGQDIRNVNKLNNNTKDRKVKSKEEFYCEDCKYTFKQKGKFDRHKRDGRCVFICEYCGKSFTSRYYSNYLCHVKYHVGTRSHKCDVCGKAYIEAQTLKIHMRKHSNTRPFICQFCGLRFFNTSALSSHTNRMHNEEYSFSKCDICGAFLSTQGNLNEHKRVVHTQVRPYVCNICGKAFKTQKMLEKIHAAVHLDDFPYVCDFANCGKKFKRTDYLTNHIKRHNNERSYFCESCNKGFYLKKELKSHMRVHTGEKPYTCRHCDFRCALPGNLSKHMKKHLKTL